MAVLLTGGTGFRGSHLVAELLKHWYKVIILDDLSTGRLENIRLLIEPSWHSDPSLFCHCEPFTSCPSGLIILGTLCHSERGEESPFRSGLS